MKIMANSLLLVPRANRSLTAIGAVTCRFEKIRLARRKARTAFHMQNEAASWNREVRCSPRIEWYNSAMNIELPDNEIEALHLTPEKVRIELAVGLYAGRQVTLGRAAKIAGISYTAFMRETGRRGICLNYRVEDALHDLEMADELCRKASTA